MLCCGILYIVSIKICIRRDKMSIEEFNIINDKLDMIAKALRYGTMDHEEYESFLAINKKRDQFLFAEETDGD
jgi:hypothetical protein